MLGFLCVRSMNLVQGFNHPLHIVSILRESTLHFIIHFKILYIIILVLENKKNYHLSLLRNLLLTYSPLIHSLRP